MSLEHSRPTRGPVRGRRLIRWPTVLEMVPFSRQHLSKLIARGEFPAPVAMGANAVAFFADEVSLWQETRPRGTLAKEHLRRDASHDA